MCKEGRGGREGDGDGMGRTALITFLVAVIPISSSTSIEEPLKLRVMGRVVLENPNMLTKAAPRTECSSPDKWILRSDIMRSD